ncbi:MAG: LamG-like jellyroll fold domain-containing protein, partial [Verrucomicrobiota bacterium]
AASGNGLHDQGRVDVPFLNSNTLIHATWGNPALSQQPDYSTNGDVWALSYDAVYHLNEVVTNEGFGIGAHRDAGPSGLHADQNGNDDVAGFLGKAQDFDGDDDLIAAPFATDQSATSPGFTWSAWIRLDSVAMFPENRVFLTGPFSDTVGLNIFNNPFNEYMIDGPGYGPSGLGFNLNEWQHLTLVYSPIQNRIVLYRNGTPGMNYAYTAPFSAPDPWVYFGASPIFGEAFDGRLDEVRLVSVPQEEDMIRATWLNMASNDVFVCYGDVSAPPPIDLVMTKSVNLPSLMEGSNLTYSLVVSNLGPLTAGGVVVTDTLPSFVSFSSSQPAPTTQAGGRVVFQLGDVLPGTEARIQLNASVSASAILP